MDVVNSVNGVPIRMTTERWYHIERVHNYLYGYYDDVLRTVEQPDVVTQGHGGSLIAHRGFGKKRYWAVVYKELKNDGFIITAYMTDRRKGRKVWPK
jgi:hypothetical protein